MTKELLILGVGNMGGAVVRSAIQQNILPEWRLTLVEPREAQVADLVSSTRVSHVTDLGDLEDSFRADCLLCAVKPQAAHEVLQSTKPFLHEKSFILSIMAGFTVAAIQEALEEQSPVIRCMPNLPLLVQGGVTLQYASEQIADSDSEMASTLFSASGSVIQVKEERLIDAGTAVSGSGPGYVFYLLQGAFDAARELGFSEEEAKLLAADTVTGAAELYRRSDKTLNTLEVEVTSKGGTTEAGLQVMKDNRLKDHITEAIQQAFKRAQELANG